MAAVEPGAEFCLFCGVACLLILWALRLVVEGKLTWEYCPVSLGLAGLFLFGVFQLLPLSPPVLAWLSPHTNRLSADLLPATPEVLALGEPRSASFWPAGSTLSLYPAATRLETIRLLAVLLLFLVVRNNVTSPGAFRRFAIAVVINGFLLALFAFVQFFSSRPKTMYWSIPVLNNLFGPFICRDHYPFYLNMCIGMGIGLLLSVGSARSGRAHRHRSSRHGSHHRDNRPEESRGPDVGNWIGSAADILQSPKVMWISLALALMISSVVFCLSRGGVVSLAGSLLVLLVLRAVHAGRSPRASGGLLVVGMAIVALAWFGFDPLKSRLNTLWTGEALEDSRLPAWVDVLAAAKDFPLWGTGYGTFLHVELAYRTRVNLPDEGWENAHNDYLEALVEGGVVRLVLSLVIIALVYRLAWRALKRLEGHSGQGLILGGIFAFTTVVIHSFVDFGLHLPAITVLATVLGAHLSTQGSPAEVTESTDQATEPFRFGRLGALAALMVALLLGTILCVEGWHLARSYAFMVEAREDEGESDPARQTRRIARLEEASRAAPELANVHLSAGQAHLDLYRTLLVKVEQQEQACQAAQLVLAAAPVPGWPSPPMVFTATAAQAPAFRLESAREDLVRHQLVGSLRHYLVARDLCPLAAKPHVQIAANLDGFAHADARSDYIRRAKQALPHNAELFYLLGLLELQDHQEDAAWASWRHSLTVSQQYLSPILTRASKQLSDEQLVARVLPERADTVVAAAAVLHSAPDSEERRPYLEKARAILDSSAAALSPEDLHLKAEITTWLGDDAAASAAYEAALRLKPYQFDWRLEHAKFLHKKGRQKEARRELAIVIDQQPGNKEAQQLLDKVLRAIIEGN